MRTSPGNRVRAGGCILAILALAGCNASYDEPPKLAELVQFEARSSTVTIPISASLDDLQARLNALVPNPLHQIDENRDACVAPKRVRFCLIPRPFGGCAHEVEENVTPAIDCHLSGAATRGDISLSGSANSLTLAMPVAVQITARGRGEIGKHIRETASGAADVVATATIDIDEAWTPSAQLNADHAWTERLGVTILGIRITFASKADEKIKETLASFQNSLPQRLGELNVKGQVEEAWRQGFTTLKVNESPAVWVRLVPEEVGFSGLSIVDRVANAAVFARVRTEVFVGEEPLAAEPTALPNLRKDLPTSGFEVVLPVAITYDAMIEAAKPLLEVGTRREFDVAGVGPVGLTIRGLSIHQTEGGAVAIGVALIADPPSSLFDTEGIVWLTGRPVVDNEAKRVRVADLKLFGIADNQLSDILIKLASLPPVTALVESALGYDFSADYAKGLAAANAAFQKEVAPGVAVTGTLTDASVDAVVAGPSALFLQLSARGNLAMTVGGGGA